MIVCGWSSSCSVIVVFAANSPAGSYTPSPGSYNNTPSPGGYTPSPIQYSPMTPGAPYTPQTPGGGGGGAGVGGLDHGWSHDWVAQDIEVKVKDSHDDSNLIHQIGVIRNISVSSAAGGAACLYTLLHHHLFLKY